MTIYTVFFTPSEAPTGTFAITGTSSAAEDSGKANGWAINDTRHDRTSDSGSWSLGGTTTKPKIAVKGTAKAPSTDATLSDLVVNDGTTDLTLDPTFVSGTFAYTTDVASSVEEVTLTATPNTGASVSAVTLGGTAIADTDFTDGITVPSLIVGENVIVVTVTAKDTTTMKTYQVTVERLQYVCAAPDLSGRFDIWSATMTVGVSGTQFGFDGIGASPYGALPDRHFDYRGIGYFIAQLYNDVSVGSLTINTFVPFPKGILDQLRLHICGETFELANRTAEAGSSYTWPASPDIAQKRRQGPCNTI